MREVGWYWVRHGKDEWQVVYMEDEDDFDFDYWDSIGPKIEEPEE